MATKIKTGSKKALIADLKRVADNCSGIVSRGYYRAHGGYLESAWEAHFSKFPEFAQAADIKTALVDTVHSTPTETNEVVGNTWTVTMPKTRISTLDELLKHCKVDLSVWQVERWVCNKWEVGAKDADKKLQVEPLFQVKATLIKKQNIVDAKAEIESLKKEAAACARVPTPVLRSKKKSGNMLEISLSDAHMGKLCWSRETGGEDYDIRIAQKLFLESVEALIDRSSGYEFDSVLFIVGNDLAHSDNVQGTTTKGTQVDCDTRYYKTFEIIRETVTKSIERLRSVAPVTVKIVGGNHDELTSWHLGDSLTAIFARHDDVTIDNEPTYRKYVQWGKCGLMFTHGDRGKRSDFPLLFARERPDIFGSTKWQEIHTGHLHQTKTEEFHGVRVRIIPSLSPADKWHSQMGFVGQQRVAEAYVWNKEEGLIGQFYYNVE